MEKLYVNKEACIGCGSCVAIDPEHFDFGDDNYSEVISQNNITTDAAKNAVASCPTDAISYVETTNDEDTCEHCENEHCPHQDEDFDNGTCQEATA